jgi:hypothetical protein
MASQSPNTPPTWANVAAGKKPHDPQTPRDGKTPHAPQTPRDGKTPHAPQKHQASAPQKIQASAPQKHQTSAPRKQNAFEDTFERELKLAIELSRQEAIREEAARQEAARQEAAREEAAHQEAARQEAARQEAARQEAARQEAAREEVAHQEAARQEAARQEAARQKAALKKEAARQEAALKKAAARQEAARQEAACQEAARQRAARQEAARQKAARQEAARIKAAQEKAYSLETSQKACDFNQCLKIIQNIMHCATFEACNVPCKEFCLQEACQDIHHRLLRQYYYINIKLLELDQYLLELNRIKSILKSTFDREQYNRCSHKSGECEKFVLEKGIKFDNIRTPEKTCNLYYNFCMSLIRKSKNHKRLIQRTLIKNSVYYSHYLNSETCPINSSCLNTKSNLKTGKCRVHRNIDSFRSSCYCVICFNQYDNNRFYRGKTVSREEFIICEKCHNESNDIT